MTPEQLEQLRRVRQDWLRTMGPLLAARNHQLSRSTLQSWEAAFTALGNLQNQAGELQWGASAAPAAEGGAGVQEQIEHPGGASEATTQFYSSMAEAGRSRQSLERELRHLADSYHRGWLCLVRFLLAILQVRTEWREYWCCCRQDAAGQSLPTCPSRWQSQCVALFRCKCSTHTHNPPCLLHPAGDDALAVLSTVGQMPPTLPRPAQRCVTHY